MLKLAWTRRLPCGSALDDPQNGRKHLQRVLSPFVFVCVIMLPKCSECQAWLVISVDIVANCCQGRCLARPRRCWMSGLCNSAQHWIKETAARACEAVATSHLCIAAAPSIRGPAGRPSEGIDHFKPHHHDTIAVNLCLSFVSKGETHEPLWLGNRSHNGGPWPLLSFQQPHHPPFSLIQTSSLPATDQLCAFSSLLYTLLESLPFYRAVLLREAEGEKNDEVGLGVRGRSRVLIWFGLGQLASLPRSSHFISNVPFSSVCNRK